MDDFKPEFYDIRDDFNFPIVNFLFLSRSIYILGSMVWHSHISFYTLRSLMSILKTIFISRGMLFIQKLLTENFEEERLKSTLHTFKGLRYELVDWNDMSVYHFTSGMFSQSWILRYFYQSSLVYNYRLSPISNWRIFGLRVDFTWRAVHA